MFTDKSRINLGPLLVLAALLVLGTGGTAAQAAAPCADLVVTSMSTVPAQPAQGLPFTPHVTVRNAGTCDAGGFSVQWKPGYSTFPTPPPPVAVTGLAAGASQDVAIPSFTFPSAGYNPTNATVDSGRTVAETNEFNNTMISVLNVVPALPDLVIANIAINQSPPYPGVPVTATITVANIGAAPAGPSVVQWATGGLSTPLRAQVGGLAPGAWTNVDLTTIFTSVGHFAGLAQVDITSAVAESVEYNNLRATSIDTVQPTLNTQRIAQGGFGDSQNSYSWSMAWFNGKLYVGTARSVHCVEAATLDFYYPGWGYYGGALDGLPEANCPASVYDTDLRAEIWQYTPGGSWVRVYQSPLIPNPRAPGKSVARDIGYRGMVVYNGVLYVGGVTADEYIPELAAAYPPRILRTGDGVNFTPLPNGPGKIYNTTEPVNGQYPIGFRAMTVYNNRLFVTASGGLTGDGDVLEVLNPAGANSFVQQSPNTTQVYEMEPFNNALYVGTGDPNAGYGVWRATSSTTPGTPFAFAPVVTNGAGRGSEITSVVSMHVFKNRLYVGANGWGSGSYPFAEEIRINPDDTWDVVVGKARTVNGSVKPPISGLGDGFGNPFTAHMWRAETHNGAMYIGTNDASAAFATVPGLYSTLQPEFGFDIWGTCDGQYWWQVTRNAFGDGRWNFGARTIVSTSSGLFIGSTNHVEGTSVWLGDASPCGATTTTERVGVSKSGGSQVAGTASATTASVSPLPPRRLLADAQACGTVLSWDATGNGSTTRYRILRSDYRAVDLKLSVLPRLNGQVLPDAMPTPARPGRPSKRQRVWVAGPYHSIGTATKNSFVDRSAKPGARYNYQVVAEGAAGGASQPSNIATVPSQTATVAFGQLSAAVQRLVDSSKTGGTGKGTGTTLLHLVTTAQASWQQSGPSASLEVLARLRTAAASPAASGQTGRVAATVAKRDVQDAILRLERRANLNAACRR